MLRPSYRNGGQGASSDLFVTTEWGASILEDEMNVLRSFDNGEFTKIYGVVCRVVGAHKGGHISEDDLHRELFATGDEIRRDRSRLRASLNKALREVAPRGPKDSSPTEYESTAEPSTHYEPPSTPWADPVAVSALWDRTVPCVLDDDAYHWLMLRGISPREVEFQRLARFLPHNAIAKMTPEQIEAVKTVLPKTKVREEFGIATRLGFRVVLPMFDVDGNMKSLRLRRMCLAKDRHGNAKLLKEDKKESEKEPKELSIKGAARGLVLCNGPALELLRGRGQRPDSWGDRELVVVIAEGVPDHLVASCEPDEAIRAVFGICGPSCWSLDMAARIPFDARVEVATDSDPQGIKYAAEVTATMPGRRVLSRWKPWSVGKNGRSKHDLADVFGLRGGVSHAVR
jgi:hypothetical protein